MNAPVAPIPADTTPVMAQFFEAKARQPDALLFFRMGDFYELFFEDAEKAASALGIALTRRGKHAGQEIPMAGVPVHAAEAYLAKLIRSGFKVAVCEQMEDPAAAYAATALFSDDAPYALAAVLWITGLARLLRDPDPARAIPFALLLAASGPLVELAVSEAGLFAYADDFGVVAVWLSGLYVHGAPAALALATLVSSRERRVPPGA